MTIRTPWPHGTFMARLNVATAHRLVGAAPARRVDAGTVLVRQGDRSGEVFLLEPCAADSPVFAMIGAVLRNGTEAMLGVRVHGDVVGEMRLFREDGEATATVTATTAMAVRAFPGEAFREFLKEHPDAWSALTAVMGDRLADSDRRRAEFVGYEVPARLARLLTDFAARHGFPDQGGTDVGIRLSQEDLGKLIGAKPDAVNKALRELRGRGLVRSGYRKVVITDPAGLREIYEEHG
ncbi:cAMP-activated global transcriptional regulator CRP [Nocardiopsis dassonvillei]|uniref:Crp/Fnr family transcriptional regulator n=1 Tax=Nocardiopsis dassonvillei TaxID=2014 RepID=UPI003F5595AC